MSGVRRALHRGLHRPTAPPNRWDFVTIVAASLLIYGGLIRYEPPAAWGMVGAFVLSWVGFVCGNLMAHEWRDEHPQELAAWDRDEARRRAVREHRRALRGLSGRGMAGDVGMPAIWRCLHCGAAGCCASTDVNVLGAILHHQAHGSCSGPRS